MNGIRRCTCGEWPIIKLSKDGFCLECQCGRKTSWHRHLLAAVSAWHGKLIEFVVAP